MKPDDLRAEHQQRVLGEPAAWELTGSHLLIAAENLVRRATCLDPVSKTFDWRVLGGGLMLRGLGVENFLKGLFVLRGGKLKTAPAGDMPCAHHDLPRMAELAAVGDAQRPRNASLLPTQEEVPMLHALKACVLYAGRYPIPRHPEDVALHTTSTIPNETSIRDERVVWSRAHEQHFGAFISRIALPFYEGKEIDYAHKDQQPGRFTWRDRLRQSMEVWVCRELIDTGGTVGDRLLSPWAVSHVTTDRDVRLTW